MTVIELPDEQAAALKEKAATYGLTLEAWLTELARQDVPRARKGRYRLSELMAGCDPNAPPSSEDRDWLDDPPVGREA